jgi:D-3-phosphoglycerate dehydrogenase / 2-oxoglutarate reductase
MKILVASSIDPTAVQALRTAYDVTTAVNVSAGELAAAFIDREVVIFRSGVQISADIQAQSSSLSLLVRAGSGLDNVDLVFARDRGVRVVRIPGSSAQPVAELTFGLLLNVARRINEADRAVRRGHWPKAALTGPLVTGKTLGIVGAGNIGSVVGQMGAAWGMRVLGCVAEHDAGIRDNLAARGIELASLAEVVAQADFLCLHVPLTESTRHLVDAEFLARMKPGAILVNMARGGVVDEDALYDNLAGGAGLRGAGLDVHACEGEGQVPRLAALDNVVLTPHIGAMATDSQRLIGRRVIEIVDARHNGRLDAELRAAERVI